MAKHVSTTAELRAMSAADLQKDIRELTGEVAKQRLVVQARTEKDTASFARAKKQLARMLTVLNQIEKPSKMPVSAKASKAKAATSSISA